MPPTRLEAIRARLNAAAPYLTAQKLWYPVDNEVPPQITEIWKYSAPDTAYLLTLVEAGEKLVNTLKVTLGDPHTTLCQEWKLCLESALTVYSTAQQETPDG